MIVSIRVAASTSEQERRMLQRLDDSVFPSNVNNSDLEVGSGEDKVDGWRQGVVDLVPVAYQSTSTLFNVMRTRCDVKTKVPYAEGT